MTYPRVLHTGQDGTSTIEFADGCRVRTGLDGITVRSDERMYEPYSEPFGPHDFWAHWTDHETRGEVTAKCYGPNTYNHVDVIVNL